MLYGGHVKALDHIELLREIDFDFGEVVLRDADARRMWRDSGVRNRFEDDFFLLAHGPFEGDPDDIAMLTTNYLPALKDSVDLTAEMEIEIFTFHLWMDSRFVKPETIAVKKAILREITAYSEERGVIPCLENLSEQASDLAPLVHGTPGLQLTLDVGHGQILADENASFGIIETLHPFIRHVHLHDNHGGSKATDDLHLTPGDGIIDFSGIMTALTAVGYDGPLTLELAVAADVLTEGRRRVEAYVADAKRKTISLRLH